MPPKLAQPTPLRKSVSFTPDTKQEDSFSAQNIFKAWAAGEDPSEVTTKESTEQPSSPSKTPKETKQPKAKKEKKKKTKQPDASDESKTEAGDQDSAESPNYVKYLEQFAEDKVNWKFNKNRQNDLFKHLFDIERIPPKHNDALMQYISTTQGQARRRIAEQAEEVLKVIWVSENEDVDPMSIDTPEERRLAYFNALAASVKRYADSGAGRTQYGDEKLQEVMREHQKGKRAELVLQRALEGELFPEQPKAPAPTTKSATTTNGATPAIPRATRVIETQKTAPGQVSTTEINLKPEAPKKRKRKSKSRSAPSDDSDNSDDSSDDGEQASKKPSLPTTKSTSKPAVPALFDADILDRKFGKKQTYN